MNCDKTGKSRTCMLDLHIMHAPMKCAYICTECHVEKVHHYIYIYIYSMNGCLNSIATPKTKNKNNGRSLLVGGTLPVVRSDDQTREIDVAFLCCHGFPLSTSHHTITIVPHSFFTPSDHVVRAAVKAE